MNKSLVSARNGHSSATFPIVEDTEFGAVKIDVSQEKFAALDAEFGDSFDAYFSNGFVLEDFPYYDGFYERVGHYVAANYLKTDISIAFCFGGKMWETAGCAAGDTVTLTVREKGKYLSRQNTMSCAYVNDRDAFDSDETFANFRAMSGGKLRKDTFFRGTSPFNDVFRRAATADSLLKKNGIRFMLNLSDNEKRLDSYRENEDFASKYAASLAAEGEIELVGLDASYRGDAFKKALERGLLAMTEHEGPYYIHCTEGKDRTGFVCLLLEALADASYEEIEADYMKSYDNYYGITKESDPARYDALKELRIHDVLWWMADLPDDTDLSGMHFKEAAENYLRSAGMTDEEIGKLESFLTE